MTYAMLAATTAPAGVGVIDTVLRTIKLELWDLSNPEDATKVVMRLVFAAALGGILGYERERKGKTAGLRTHILVALGSALFVLVPDQLGVSDGDIARVLQGLIAGVGFLGAGAIVKGAGGGSSSSGTAPGAGMSGVAGAMDGGQSESMRKQTSDPDAYEHGEVRGLTTAANLWMTAAIGMCVGLGRETTAVLATGLALFVLSVLPHGGKAKRR